MAKRKKRRRRRRVTRAFRRHRRRSKGMPLSAITGIATSVLASPSPGWGSPLEKIEAGKMDEALQSFIKSWTGVAIGGIGGQTNTEFNAMTALNPLDMTDAPAWKTMFWTAIGTKLIKKVIKTDPFAHIPFVGKFIRFS